MAKSDTLHIHKYDALLAELKMYLDQTSKPRLVAISGPPATGKSTLAEKLVRDLKQSNISTALCPMDGFHLSNAELSAAGLAMVKGRIDTFDAAKFSQAVSDLKAGSTFWWPKYCRQLHEPVTEGTWIEGTETVYIIEGNYLLSSAQPWRRTATLFDICIFVDTPDAELRKRLLQRHLQSGRSAMESQRKIEQTDLPNAQIIREDRIGADIEFNISESSF